MNPFELNQSIFLLFLVCYEASDFVGRLLCVGLRIPYDISDKLKIHFNINIPVLWNYGNIQNLITISRLWIYERQVLNQKPKQKLVNTYVYKRQAPRISRRK